MSEKPSMQEVIRRLNAFWADQGCTIWQPHSEKVGAGTMNPATVLRVLGPEPWNVGYVEPSFRADDGRYAENPNRMQMHTQYQVILKPDPGNPQELYLDSLAAIGLDRTRHDIRFVEDNWESPALGAWGLGWEVWLDGQEITQFTYFQQAGGQMLDPVSVEITYGLERIVLYLQEKTEVWSIDYDGTHTYGDIYREQEIEHCVYNFELADVERHKQMYELYRAEAESCIDRGLVAPAHDYVLRQSQTFNILDARGAIGVTERAKFFADMRSQARRVSELYTEQRQRLEYPWLHENGAAGEQGADAPESSRPQMEAESGPQTAQATISAPQSFLLELGSEELPPSDVQDGIAQIQISLASLLDDYRLSYGTVRVTGTPRRLVAHVTELAHRQQDEVVERKGPPADRAYSADGSPTKAATGFARGQGVDVSQLEVRDNYVYAVQKVEGKATVEILPQILSELLDGLRWNKTMRWNRTNVNYPRPLRWIVALYGSQIIPFDWAGVHSGNVSRGARYADAAAELPVGGFSIFSVASAAGYFDAVAQQGIVLDRQERRQRIADMVVSAAATAGGDVPTDPDLLDEVTDLVESPTPVLGKFEEKYLGLPKPVLIGVMKKHQRYFPVVDNDGNLKPYFITIANADSLPHPEVVTRGNEGVIRARYADAEFFWKADTAKPLDEFTPELDTLTFHDELGSMLDKVHRLQKLAPTIAEMLRAGDTEIATVIRAAALSKSDLVTSMVVEMTSLQGVMGEIYALKSGEDGSVAQAIREHYLPRYAGDISPESLPGLALSLADKLDSLAGLFGVGVRPSGSADPYGLRRAALGIVNNLMVSEVDFSIDVALRQTAEVFDLSVEASALAGASDFITKRLQGVLLETGYPHDVVDAVLAERGDNPYMAEVACKALADAVARPGWEDAFTAYARCARIVRSLDHARTLNPGVYETEEERILHDAYEEARSAMNEADDQADSLGDVLCSLEAPVNAFFESVLVNAEDEEVRHARQALVQRIAALPDGVADLSHLQGF